MVRLIDQTQQHIAGVPGCPLEIPAPCLAQEESSADQHTPSRNLLQSDHVPPSPYRSASVASSIFARQEEDISAIMMRGANDLRNTRVENEEQRREIAFLRTQLDAAKSEKDDVLKRLSAVKEAAKRTLDSSSQSLRDMDSALKELKSQSESSFEVITRARESLPEIQEMRKTISDAINNIQPLLNDQGYHMHAFEARSIIKELQLECTNTQQVADLLRDRLKSVGADLVDARMRVSDVEAVQDADRKALRDSISSLASATSQISALAESLKIQEARLQEALASAANTEARLASASQEITSLRGLVGEKDAELATLSGVQQENCKLRLQLDSSQASLSTLTSVKDELKTTVETLHDRDKKIGALETLLSAREESISEAHNRSAETEARWREEHALVMQVKDELKACEVRERDTIVRIERLTQEKTQLSEKILGIENSLQGVSKDLEIRTERLHQATTRSQVLEERFEEQAVTLKITKECNGDLQAQSSYATKLEQSTGKFTCEIVVLKEQKTMLQTQFDDLELQLRRKDEETRSLVSELEAKIRKQELEHTMLLTTEQQRAAKGEDDLRITQARMRELESNLSATSTRVVELQQELKYTNIASSNRQEEMDALKSHVKLLEASNDQLRQMPKTIDVRYKAGDLAVEEKAFIQCLLQTSQSMHEQELVAKGNELRRRDNTIKELRAKLQAVETALAKQLCFQAQNESTELPVHSPIAGVPQMKTQPTAGSSHQSMIDPASWMSSDLSSPPGTVPLVPLSDKRTKEDLALQVQNPEPIELSTARTPSPAKLEGKCISPQNVLSVHQPGPALQTTVRLPSEPTAAKSPARPQFSRLATDCSDEIDSFEDDPIAIQSTSSAIGLGKRGQISYTFHEAPAASRQPKRSTVHAQKTTAARKPAEVIARQPAETAGTKSRPKRKR
ncbi:hypothetical protein CERSUDRAFT_91505 [Gelatoporia subvermispora B]|uniref:Uncharacterized protein n=1 Tax=Ceriporiopsis subvermispora (strain B) TaxID=914234 RepID=M2PVG8_CERS8|nr:hypothetical protein CERSUDRAFT_91505 [Gelatoporia subvermispora B]